MKSNNFVLKAREIAETSAADRMSESCGVNAALVASTAITNATTVHGVAINLGERLV